MSPELIAVLTVNAVLFGMTLKLMLNLDALRERMARLEGLFEFR